MSYFNVTHCTYGDVYTYDSGRCVKSNLSHSNEICKISVLEDCELEVNVFSLAEGKDGDLLVHDGTSYTGSSGPEEGLNLHTGDLFTFIAGTSSGTQSTSNGFDMCCTNIESFELRDGTEASEGNVYLNGQPICNDHWDTNDAAVVCRVLGYDDGQTANSSAFGAVPNNFIMNSFGCFGDETSIWDCAYTTHSNCDSDMAAGVKCSTETTKRDNYARVVAPVLILAFVVLIGYIIRWRNNRLKSHQHNQYDQLGIALQKQEEEKAATKAAATKQKASKDVPKDPARVSYQPLLDSNLPNFKSSSEEDSVEEFPEDVEIIRLASDVTAGNEASAPPAPMDSNPAYEPPSYHP